MARNLFGYTGVEASRRIITREKTTMWLSFFSIATAVSLGLGIAAYKLQNATQEEFPQG